MSDVPEKGTTLVPISAQRADALIDALASPDPEKRDKAREYLKRILVGTFERMVLELK